MTGLRFTKDHEYLRIEGDTAVVGITDFAQQQLGDIVFVDLPKVGKKVTKGSELAVIESVKAASEVYAPVTGEVIEVNAELGEKPALVNESPLDGGWLVKLRVATPDETASLMDEDGYASFLKTL
ncbi:glycine cleavage system protein GcvH [Methylocystis echinoides]|jgi:glycine cleavage system H protein|uniref:Glycine cleavage system H protein n=1 Tax=Methylocystis echinoides TaxID=29468 RepID=A0A9W6GRA4_9HYPH|nr:glycine cleavage system protein GcvH [Methylocystis echinoides]GLI91480.1 glycine cleavage system H protein [Methylocystis echinoides]